MIQSSTGSTTQRPRSLFWRLLLRSLSVKRPQALLAIGSVVVGAAVASMLFNLYGDVRRKMTREFRAYGANVLLVPASGGSASLGGIMDEDALSRLEPIRERSSGLTAAPVLYVVVRVGRITGDSRASEFHNAVAVGTDLLALRRLFPAWRVEGGDSPLELGTCALGARAASTLRLGLGDRVKVEMLGAGSKPNESASQEFRVSNLVTTGASEDDQVFIPLNALQRLAGLEGKVSMIELRVPGRTAEVERITHQLAQTFPDLEARPLRQIVYSEGRILDTIRTLMISLGLLIVTIIALCVAATMTALVLERRRDIAVMKALGASDRTVLGLFLSEAAGLGLMGGAAGFVLGELAARYLATRLFGVALRAVWWSFPLVCLGSLLVTLLATAFPVRIARGVHPATVLKGE